jgi:hypothetical protein
MSINPKKFTHAELVQTAHQFGLCDDVAQLEGLTKAELIAAIEEHQAVYAENVGTVVVSTDALSQDEARTVAHRMGRPVWEGGESRQAFDARLAAWKSAQAS